MRSSSLTVPRMTIEGPLPVIPRSPYGRLRSLAWSGIMLVAVFIIGFGAWAMYAPLESAAVASGVVEVESSSKTIQHLEGGIIGRILVRDGDVVKAGQALVQLADTRPRTSLASLSGQLWNALAREARLLAERDNLGRIAWPRELSERADNPTVAEILAGQERIFAARQAVLQSRQALIRQRVAQVQEEIVGLNAQQAAASIQLDLIRQEIVGVKELYDKGLERKPRLLALERALAEIEGHRGEYAAQIAQARQVIAESEMNLVNLVNENQDKIATSLRETQLQLSQLREQIESARDVMSRTAIRAPEDGVVTNLRIHTPGGVIAPGQPLMDLVPAEDRLVIRAKVSPDDIDMIHDGLPAQVRLTPYKHRRVPPLEARVTYVAADHQIEDDTGHAYYEATIDLTEAAWAQVAGVDLVPGMPAEVMIETGETTVALYALAPVLDSFNRAFREN